MPEEIGSPVITMLHPPRLGLRDCEYPLTSRTITAMAYAVLRGVTA
jgi:hypothetical protein